MKRISITILSVFIFTCSFAQNEGADAVFEKITKTFTLNDDGSQSYRYFKQIKLLTHVSFNRLYGETFIVYDPDYQELKINESYTIMADGRKIEAPDNAFNEVLPRGAAHSASFNQLREMVVTHTGLEPGATIYLDYTLTTRADFLPALMGNEIIQESSPVREMEIIVKVPLDVELRHKMFNLRTAPEIMVMGSEKVYTWKFGGLRASAKESFRGNMPETARLVFSSEENPGTVLDWMMQQKTFDYKISSDMEKFVADMKNPAEEMKTMLAIQEEVVKNMKHDRVPPEWTGYRVRTPEDVWKSNGGTELEKAALLSALLNAAGIYTLPVLTFPRKFYDNKIACLPLLDRAYVMANTKSNGTIYLSAVEMNSQTLQYVFEDDVIAPLEKNADLRIIEPSGNHNEISLTGKIKISDDLEITGSTKAELSGATNPFLLLQQDKQKFKTQISGGIVAKTDEAIGIINSNPAKTELQIEFGKEGAIKDHLGFYRFTPPEMKTGFAGWHIRYLAGSREDAFVLPFVLKEQYAYDIEIPAGYEFVNEKKSVRLKNKSGSVKIEVSPKNNIVTVERELDLNTQIITPDQYADFRALINEWLDENHKMIVFRKAVD